MSKAASQALWMAFWGCAVATFIGCGESKSSLHELDHVTPGHWPTDLADAASKMRDRLATLDEAGKALEGEPKVAFDELSDLVQWVPEVAADTDLGETQWNKLYQASEAARKQLLGVQRVEPSLKQDIEKLCALLIESHALLPKPLGFDYQPSTDQAEN
jgi:hypothetical protein